MGFLRIIELFPPLFPISRNRTDRIAIEEKIEMFVEEARSIRDYADIFLIASLKGPDLLKLSTIQAAYMLQERLRVQAAPVIVVRDANRLQFLSALLTAISLELSSIMLVWGDDYPASVRVTNNRDYPSLTEAIKDATVIKQRSRAKTMLLAPVDLDRLGGTGGIKMARDRVKAGVELLLAQPPTTDAGTAFDKHSSLLEEAGLKDKVLLNIFPFRDAKDVKDSERYFGWKLPRSLHAAAASGRSSLLAVERDVVRRLREESFPGIYLTTRGEPSIAERLLSIGASP